MEVERFMKWVKGIGICEFPLYISNFHNEGGRGLAASKDIKRGELILKVPNSALFTTHNIFLNDDRISFYLRNRPSFSPSQVLVVCLLAEVSKGKRSFWYPYLQQLPRSYDLLSCFTKLEAKALQVEEAISVAENASSKAELEWKQTLGLLEELRVKPRLQTLRAWLWASATVSSRTLYIPGDDAGCLCPVGDLFNYASPTSHITDSVSDDRIIDAGFEDDVGAYCFYAREDYIKGEQVLMGYGMYTNLELLEHYGFVLKENDNDKVFASFAATPLIKPSSLYISHDGVPSFCTMLALRTAVATKSNTCRTAVHRVYTGSSLPLEEAKVLEVIISWCVARLKIYETSVEQDIQLLNVVGENERRLRLAVLWRIMYKSILVKCIFYCNKQELE